MQQPSCDPVNTLTRPSVSRRYPVLSLAGCAIVPLPLPTMVSVVPVHVECAASCRFESLQVLFQIPFTDNHN